MAEQEEEESNDKKKLFNWPPLESNPDVFTNYMHKVGLPAGFGIGEVYGFDEDLLAFLPQPILATIVCCERLKKDNDKQLGHSDNESLTAFYMKQSSTLDNACGIIACLHATLNNTATVKLAADSVLGKFASGTSQKSPQERCTALEDNTEFQTIHKGYASEGQSKEITSDQSAVKHHYIAYVLSQDGKQLLELDGTKQGPHVVNTDCTDVLRGSIAEIQRKLREGEISESLNMMTLNAIG